MNDPILTYNQISAADELYHKHLPNWRFAVETFAYLKKQDFGTLEVCLVMAVAVDTLFATGLRYKPGRCEDIARRIFDQRVAVASMSKVVDPAYLRNIAKDFAKVQSGDGPISFFSKFFHFFVSDNYPIFDNLAREVLRGEHDYPNKRLRTYPEFCGVINELRDQVASEGNGPVSVREIDRYLWLMGKYRGWQPVDNSLDENSGNEVIDLFNKPKPQQLELLKKLTKGDYEVTKSSGRSRRKRVEA